SSAATNICSAGAATLSLLSLLLLLLRLAGDRLARSTRQAHDHLAGNAQVEADDPVPKKTGRFVEPSELDQRRTRGFFALGKGKSLAGLEIQIPAPAADPGGGGEL